MSNVSISAALIKALCADSERHFWALLASAIEVHQASFQEFPVETPMHTIGDGDFTLSVRDALQIAANALKFTDADSLNAVGTLLSAKHAALYNNPVKMFEIAVNAQIYGRFCPDAVPITRSEIGDHIAKLLPQGWSVQGVTTCAAYSKKRVNLPPHTPYVDYRTFDLGEPVDYSRALVVLQNGARENALVLVIPSVTFRSDGVPEWRHKYITSANVKLPRIEILE